MDNNQENSSALVPRSSFLIKAGRLFTGDEWLQPGAMLIANGTIVEVGEPKKLEEKYPAARVEDLGEMLVVPGTVNAHNHSFQSLMRGLGDDKDFFRWRDDGIYKY